MLPGIFPDHLFPQGAILIIIPPEMQRFLDLAFSVALPEEDFEFVDPCFKVWVMEREVSNDVRLGVRFEQLLISEADSLPLLGVTQVVEARWVF